MSGTEPLLGIDLGTTLSVVALAGTGVPEAIVNRDGERRTPSAVYIRPDGTMVVGARAQRESLVDPDAVFEFFKRDMGRAASYRFAGKELTPTDLSAAVLTQLREDAEAAVGGRVGGAVVTIPAYFGDDARRATVDAAKRAGLDVMELIHEPTAAALAYGARFGGRPHTALVYDLGGGTFDVSVVRFAEGVAEVLATAGDHRLGGKDWDEILIGILRESVDAKHGVDPFDDPAALVDLRERAREAKHALSAMDTATVTVVHESIRDRVEITRAEFEAASAPLLERTERLVEQVLGDIAVNSTSIDEVLLVGGSTRMNACRPLVTRVTGIAPKDGVDPDESVAIGAAYYASHLGGGQSIASAPSHAVAGAIALTQVKDVTPHALGFVVISADGSRYVNEVMIQRNAQIPAESRKLRKLDTPKGRAGELNVYLLQGESLRPLDTAPLGRWTFKDVPTDKRGEAEIDISFGYDRDGIVEISAQVGGVDLAVPIVDREDRDISWTDEDPSEMTGGEPLTVCLVIDCSGSMAGGKIAEARRACIEFAKELSEHPSCKLALISFSSSAHVVRDAQPADVGLDGAVSGLTAAGGTDMAAGLQRAREITADAAGRRAVVLLTDGYPNNQSATLAAAAALARDDVEIHPRGVAGADESFLRQLAHGEGDLMTDLDGLANSFRGIARQLAGSGALKRL